MMPPYGGIWILSPPLTKKAKENVVRVGPPLTKLSGSMHDVTLTNFRTKYFIVCKVYNDVGGIK